MNFQYFRFFLSPMQGNLLSQLDDSRINSIQEVFKTDFDGKYKGCGINKNIENLYIHFKHDEHISGYEFIQSIKIN